MIKFYFNLSPNPMKVALFLEEAELPYEAIAVDARKGEQFAPDFLAINPNGKVPAIKDGETVVFDSNAILLYLGEKTGKFMPANNPAARGEMLSWLMFVASGMGPFLGQAVHFKNFAPEPIPYANTRYQFEAKRHLDILNERLASRRYMLGDAYSIIDMQVWGWARMTTFILGDDAWTGLPNLKRLFDEINARPATQRVNAFREAQAGKFKAQMDDEARAHMFRHLAGQAA
ncbi:glutathione S-transferase family protein [Terrarubrum flagellatum]|uniref:glutathione S-transferase family protein n=1 Tax=Terrirubrum flagellatum TaxID=2895980 RepID=UPI0031451A53